MLDKLKDFKETLSERIRSPFIGSFVISWCVLHWKVFVLLSYNEDNIKIQERISQVTNYLNEQTFYTLVCKPIWTTLLVILAYNILNAIGLVIKLLYDNWISPYIQKLLYNKNIVEKSKLEKIKREYSQVKTLYEEEREKFIESEKQVRDLKNNFENYRRKSVEYTVYHRIEDLFGSNTTWQNEYKNPKNNQNGKETFVCHDHSFDIEGHGSLLIENIRSIQNEKIILFDKTFSNGTIQTNYLIKTPDGNYIGREGNDVQIKYTKIATTTKSGPKIF